MYLRTKLHLRFIGADHAHHLHGVILVQTQIMVAEGVRLHEAVAHDFESHAVPGFLRASTSPKQTPRLKGAIGMIGKLRQNGLCLFAVSFPDMEECETVASLFRDFV